MKKKVIKYKQIITALWHMGQAPLSLDCKDQVYLSNIMMKNAKQQQETAILPRLCATP